MEAGFKAVAALLSLQADLLGDTAGKLWSGLVGMGQQDSDAPAVALLRCGVLSRLVCWAAENCALPHPPPVGVPQPIALPYPLKALVQDFGPRQGLFPLESL